jgi:tripartite-type tricarboxylate transporter receptor subunit TctC
MVMNIKRWLLTLFAPVVLVSAFVINGSALQGQAAESPEHFYKGKTIRLVVPFSPGGSTDLTARGIAPHLKQYTGATVIVENKRGGGGLEGMNYVYKVAKADGLTLLVTDKAAVIANELLESPGVQYEMKAFEWISGMNGAPFVFCANPKYHSVRDLQAAKGLKFGGASPKGWISLGSALVTDIFDLDAKVIVGFRGTAPQVLAMNKGELDGSSLDLGTGMRNIDKGAIRGLFLMTIKGIEMRPEPPITELADLSAQQRRFLKAYETLDCMKVIMATPNTPLERVRFLRVVFDKINERKDFQDDVKEFIGYWLGHKTGNSLEAEIKELEGQKEFYQAFYGRLKEYYATIRK